MVISQLVPDSDPEPIHARIRQVTKTQATIVIELWTWNGTWKTKTGYVMVVEPGTHILPDGRVLWAVQPGTLNHNAQTHAFPTSYSETPVVLAQSQTMNDNPPIITRVFDVTTTGYSMKLDENETMDDRDGGAHRSETMGVVVLGQVLKECDVTYSVERRCKWIRKSRL